MTDTATRPSRRMRIVYAIWRRRYRWLAVADAIMWAVALPVATFARQEFAIRSVNVGNLIVAIAIAAGVHVVAGILTGLYLGRHRLASFDEVRWVAITALIPVAVLLLILLISPGVNLVPRSAILAGAAYQIVGSLAVRYVLRVMIEQRRISAHPKAGRLLIFGAGDAGYQAIAPDAFASARDWAESVGGALVIEAAPDELRTELGAWGTQPQSLDLQRAVKERFDPFGICNPGILPGGL